jgi:hypothetical protein
MPPKPAKMPNITAVAFAGLKAVELVLFSMNRNERKQFKTKHENRHPVECRLGWLVREP